MRLPAALRRISRTRIIKLLYQSEAGLLIAVGCAQVRNMPRHQFRCDTSTARILSDAQSLFGRYEYERPNVLEGHRLSELSEWIKGSEHTSQNVFFVGYGHLLGVRHTHPYASVGPLGKEKAATGAR